MEDVVIDNQTIRQLMLMAQASMEQPRFDAVNPHFKNRYATLSECQRVVREACNPVGLFVAFDKEGDMVYTRVASASEELRLFPVRVSESGNPQQNGSALTYAKRYSLCGAFGLSAEDDDDGNAASGSDQPRYKAPVKSQKAAPRQQPPVELKDAYAALSKACSDRDEALCMEPGSTSAEVRALPDFQSMKNDVGWVSGMALAIELGDF